MAVAVGDALVAVYSAYPAAVFVYYVLCSIFLWLRPRRLCGSERGVRASSRRLPIIVVLSVIVSLSVVNALVVAVLSSSPVFATGTEYSVVGQLSCALVFAVQLSHLLDNQWPIWHPFQGSWAIALLSEILFQCLVLSAWASGKPISASDIVSAAFAGTKCLLLVTLMALTLPYPNSSGRSTLSNAECQPLLSDNGQAGFVPQDQGLADPGGYGSMSDTAMGNHTLGENGEADGPASTRVTQITKEVCKVTSKGFYFADGLAVRLSLAPARWHA